VQTERVLDGERVHCVEKLTEWQWRGSQPYQRDDDTVSVGGNRCADTKIA